MQLFETSWTADKVEDGVMHNVKVLGNISKNKFAYPKETREKAVSILENAKVNLDHVKKNDVSISSRFGKLVNVQTKEDGTYADLHYLTSHPMANAIKEAAEKMPEILGLSLLGEGTGKNKDKDGNTIIESIDRVFSVDLVANPATNTSLFEAEQEEEEEDLSAEDHVWEGVKNGVMACLDEDGSVDEKLSKIKKLLKAHDKAFDKEEEDDDNDEVEESEKNKSEILDRIKLLEQKLLVKTPKSGVPVVIKEQEVDFNKLLRGIWQ